jgi:hypothetical protein
MTMAAVAYGVTLALFYVSATVAIMLFGKLPVWLESALAIFVTGLPLLGFAESLSSLDIRRYSNWAIAGLSIGLVVMLWVL